MSGETYGPSYRLAVREQNGAWNWTLLQGESVAMTGNAPDLPDALRRADFAAGAHAAFERIARRRF
jgi:hypothetical protein